MTASEFSFLALGLALGVLSGAALVELVRARSPASHEVRLTVAHDAIPRRSTTLADDAFISSGPEPGRGGPADRRLLGGQMAVSGTDRRTSVRFATAAAGAGAGPMLGGAIPVGRGPDVGRRPDPPVPGRTMEPALPLVDPRGSGAGLLKPQMVGVPVSSGDDPMLGALRGDPAEAALAASAGVAEPGSPASAGAPEARPDVVPPPIAAMTALALLDRPLGRKKKADPAATERCAEERRIAEERCELAGRARARAADAIEALRIAQRTYDGHEAAAVTAAWRADPRAVHDAKDAAQGGFRAAVTAATSP